MKIGGAIGNESEARLGRAEREEGYRGARQGRPVTSTDREAPR